MNCTCLEDIDKRLAEKNLKLNGYAFVMPDFRIRFYISTGWVDRTKAPKGKKNNPPYMFVSFCPFCGQPIEKDQPEPTETPPPEAA